MKEASRRLLRRLKRQTHLSIDPKTPSPLSEFLFRQQQGEKERSSDKNEGDKDGEQIYACSKQQGNRVRFALCC